MEIIGEASNHISEETKSSFTAIEWSQIVGMRNVFVHEYFGVDSSLVWEIIKNDIPDLKVKIKELRLLKELQLSFPCRFGNFVNVYDENKKIEKKVRDFLTIL